MSAASHLDRGAFLNGEWRRMSERVEVVSPYSGERVGFVGWGGASEAVAAIDAASTAMRRPLPAHERARVLQRAAQLLSERADVFVTTLAAEIGKPVKAGRVEVLRATSTLEICAVEARKLAGHAIPMDATAAGTGKFATTFPTPIGVVGAITPFNFPLNLACHKVGPAIAAGCGVVLKPADKAPLTACLLADLLHDAGLPSGMLNLLVGEPVPIAQTLADDPRVGLITFTGSAEIGWDLRARAPRKRVSLELGNATPVIVDETATGLDVGRSLAASAFAFSGQSCISAQRVYAHEGVFDAVVTGLTDQARALVVGDPADDSTDIGPLINPAATQRVLAVIEEAVASGARLELGGDTDGPTLRPTVLTRTASGARVLTDEVFGPVVTVEPFEAFDDAIGKANDTRYGLQTSVYTARIDRVAQAAEQLQFGSVLINEIPSFRADQMPYGGIKDSGNTREGPAYAVHEMTSERLLIVTP